MEPTLVTKKQGLEKTPVKKLQINRARIEQLVDYDNKKWKIRQKLYSHIDGVSGYGTPISKSAAKKMISEYWEELKLQCQNAKQGDPEYNRVMKSTIAVTFGREALLSILSQPDCEGIRFYFSKKPVELENIDSVVNKNIAVDSTEITASNKSNNSKNSLVAVGVKKDGRDLGCKNSVIEDEASEIKLKSGNVSISAGNQNNGDTLIREIVPPSPLEDLLKLKSPTSVQIHQLRSNKFPYELYFDHLSDFFNDIKTAK